MKTHHLKCWPEFFEAVIDGRKPFEVRENDRGYEVGDMLVLNEYRTEEHDYTGRKAERTITYILPFGIMPGIDRADSDYVVLGLRDPNDGWIPCSERLPESGKHMLLSCETKPSGRRYVCDGFYAERLSIECGGGDDIACEYDEESDEYYLEEGYYEVVKNWDDYSSIAIGDTVVAHQPLPEPYEGEE